MIEPFAGLGHPVRLWSGQHTEVVHQVGIDRPALSDAVPTLTPTTQIVAQSFKHVPVQLIDALIDSRWPSAELSPSSCYLAGPLRFLD